MAQHQCGAADRSGRPRSRSVQARQSRFPHCHALGRHRRFLADHLGGSRRLHPVARPFGGLGICVGYHRLLTHRSFKCSKAVEYTLALLGTLTLEGGPIDWVAHHRQHHQYSDEPGDPHSARDGFFWSHVLWMFWTPNEKDFNELTERYTPDLLRQPFYRFLGRYYLELSIALAVLLYLLGGWPFVVWGMCVRLVITYHSTWLVNSASHTFGYRNFDVSDLSTNCWWVALRDLRRGLAQQSSRFPHLGAPRTSPLGSSTLPMASSAC